MRLAPRSVRTRLTLWYTVVLSIPLATFAVGSYVVFSRELHERTDAFITDALNVFGRELIAERRSIPDLVAAINVTLAEVRFQNIDIVVRDESGRVLAATTRFEGTPVRRIERPHTVSDRRLTLTGIYPTTDVDAMLARIRRMFWIAIPLFVAAAAAGGWILAGRSLEPVERAFEQQRRFMADASHELRTPSAVLRAEADITLSRPTRAESEYRESMTVVQDAARRLGRIVDDIFLLARADAGHLVMHPVPVDLDDIVVDSVRAIQAIASAKAITIDLRDAVEARVHGDADLLGRVLLNLLDNAVKHSSHGSTVEVRMARTNGRVDVTVADSGPGIPAEARERVFERFYRVDTARARSETTTTSGAGLGLPIARRIAEMHGGQVELVASAPGRTEFRFSVPALAGGGA